MTTRFVPDALRDNDAGFHVFDRTD